MRRFLNHFTFLAEIPRTLWRFAHNPWFWLWIAAWMFLGLVMGFLH